METKYALLRADYWVQTVLGICIIICFCSVAGAFFAILGLIPFGTWQVLSGLILGLGYHDTTRLKYLGVVAIYFVIWFGTYYIHLDLWPILTITPLALAIWYYMLTKKEYKNFDIKIEDTPQYENLLDA